MVYLSDCQTGAAAGCVPGNNANPGTEASPKRDLAGVNLNTLPAGASVLFKRGGAWNVTTRLDNRNATPTAPLTLGDYGAGPLPLLRTPSGTTFDFGLYGNADLDGGYTFRNLKLDGLGTGTWGAFVQGRTRAVTFDGVEVSGFAIGIHVQSQAGKPNDQLTVRNSFIHHNSEHGMLGAGNADFVFENNRIEDNNPSGGGFEHGTYFSPGALEGRNARIVGNTYRRNSAPGGSCDGGNMTLHGMWDGLLIEGNLIEQAAASSPGCWGISVTAGYSSAEWFRNLTVRGNRVVNVGNAAIIIQSAINPLVEGNVSWTNQPEHGQAAVVVQGGVNGSGGGDDAGSGGTIRNNTACFNPQGANQVVVRSTSAGATAASNALRTGADAATGPCAR